MHYAKSTTPPVSAGPGHLPPVSAGFGTTAQPGAGGWVSGALLSGPYAPRALALRCMTGAFGTITGCQFKLREATDANGTGAADKAGGAGPNITTANTEAEVEIPLAALAINPAAFYAVACAVSGSAGAALVAAALGVIDPVNAA